MDKPIMPILEQRVLALVQSPKKINDRMREAQQAIARAQEYMGHMASSHHSESYQPKAIGRESVGDYFKSAD